MTANDDPPIFCDASKICPKCLRHCGCVCYAFRGGKARYVMGSANPRSFRCCFCRTVPESEFYDPEVTT